MSEDYIIETLDPKDFDEWVGHCAAVFGFDGAAEYFRRHFMCDPHRDYGSVFIIKAGGKIVSTVRVFRREVYLGGKIYKMGGVGEVSTNPEYQRRGLSYKLMAAATEYMQANGFYLSMLGTGYYGHYEKHGFRQVKHYSKVVSAGCEPVAADIRPLTAADYGHMAELYAKHCAGLNCCMVRTGEYWQQWCAAELKNPHGCFDGGKLTGYICYDGGWVSEIIAPDAAVCDCLLSAVKAEKGELVLPKHVETARKLLREGTDDNTMVCLYKPIKIEAGGLVLEDTAALVDWLNANGGIMQWSHDGF